MDRSVAGILLRSGKVFTARRPPGGALGGRWEFPGGKVEESETDEAALEREFLEEFGARITAQRLLGEDSFVNKGRKRVLAAWLAELLPGAVLVPHEHSELRWASRTELLNLDLAESDKKLLPLVERLLCEADKG